MNGLINVLKPTGMSSHDVVSFIRRNLNIKKVGHTGTLDPNAAGVLPICVGKATKVSQYLVEKSKKYRCELTLGLETDTQDKYGNIINKSQVSVNETDIKKVFDEFKGEIEQIPPMYSAIRHKGKKLYEIAREGKEVERKPRKVTIFDIRIINIRESKRILFDVECSKGTYIRTLCSDIGKKIGTYGYMTFLLRTEVEAFKLEETYTIEEIENYVKSEELNKIILPIDYPLKNYRKIVLDNRYRKVIINGGKIPCRNIDEIKLDTNNKYRVYCDEDFMGIGIVKVYEDKNYLKMEKVLV